MTRIQTAEARELLRVIRSLFLARQDSKLGTRRFRSADSKLLSTAEGMFHSELAFVLGIEVKDVVPYIHRRLSEGIPEMQPC